MAIASPEQHQADAQHVADTAAQLFFIIGSGRSGTSLLSSMISAHPQAIVPPETKFYSAIWKKFRRLGMADAAKPRTFDKMIDLTLRQWYIRDLELPEDMFRRMCHSAEPSMPAIFLTILTLYRQQHGMSRVGEKSPGHTRHIGYLQAQFPKAKFLHIVRDPRAVVLSYRQVKFANRVIWPKLRNWRQAAALHRQWSQRLGPTRYHLTHYEQLVTEPETTMRAISKFLDLPFDPMMVHPEKRQVAGFNPRQVDHMQNTLKPVFTTSLTRWRDELSHSQIALIESALAEPMQFMGYELSGARTVWPRSRLALSCLAHYLGRPVQSIRTRLVHMRQDAKQGS